MLFVGSTVENRTVETQLEGSNLHLQESCNPISMLQVSTKHLDDRAFQELSAMDLLPQLEHLQKIATIASELSASNLDQWKMDKKKIAFSTTKDFKNWWLTCCAGVQRFHSSSTSSWWVKISCKIFNKLAQQALANSISPVSSKSCSKMFSSPSVSILAPSSEKLNRGWLVKATERTTWQIRKIQERRVSMRSSSGSRYKINGTSESVISSKASSDKVSKTRVKLGKVCWTCNSQSFRSMSSLVNKLLQHHVATSTINHGNYLLVLCFQGSLKPHMIQTMYTTCVSKTSFFNNIHQDISVAWHQFMNHLLWDFLLLSDRFQSSFGSFHQKFAFRIAVAWFITQGMMSGSNIHDTLNHLSIKAGWAGQCNQSRIRHSDFDSTCIK